MKTTATVFVKVTIPKQWLHGRKIPGNWQNMNWQLCVCLGSVILSQVMDSKNDLRLYSSKRVPAVVNTFLDFIN